MSTRVHLVVGGQSSGKSAWAESLVLAATPDWLRPTIICPCAPSDEAMRARITAHQAVRSDRWDTVESFDLLGVLDDLDPDVPVLVDALDTWLSQLAYDLGLDQPDPPNEAAHSQQLIDVMTRFGRKAATRFAPTVVIAGVPGLGMVPLGQEVRRLVDLHGKLTQALTPDLVTWIHAGRVLAQG